MTLYVSSVDEMTWQLSANHTSEVFAAIPERKQSRSEYNSWLVKATDTTVEAIVRKITLDDVKFTDDFAKLQFASIRARTAMSDRVREQTAAFKESKVLPNRYISCDSRIAPHQEIAAANAHVSEGYAFFMEQGTGKTLSGITVIDNLPKGAKVIVVCPNNVRFNWENEIRIFSQRKTKCSVIRGGQMNRLEQLIMLLKNDGQDASVCVVGYDSIPGMWQYLHLIKWDLAILDESQYIKGPKSKRWEYVQKLRDNSAKRIVMTGTPVANNIMDLFTQLEFLGEGVSGFTDFNAYKKFFGVYEKQLGDESHSRLVALQNIPIMKDRLSRYSFLITKKEALPDLPAKVYDIEEVEMTEEQQIAYDKLLSDLSFQFEGMDQDNPLVVNNILTQLLKLAEITSGFLRVPAVKSPDGEIIRNKQLITFADNPKLNRLMEILQEKKYNEKTIIWCCSVPSIERIAKACEIFGIKAVTFYGATDEDERREAERLFNEDPETKVFIGNPGAGGTGLNLLGYPPGFPDVSETNADHVIYFDMDWSSLKRSQSEDRCHRRGTRTNIRITDLCIPGTIDQTIRERVVEKRLAAFDITDVRAILKEVMNRG